jgi:hypothetical protein
VRQRIALTLCVLWLVSFELMPWLHVALHDQLAPHTHDASGAVILVEDTPHEHAHVHHHRRSRADDLTRLADRLAHGAHALAHHGIAVPVPSPVWLTPLPVDRRPTHVDAVAIAGLVSPELVRAVARGPPSIVA